MIFAIVGILGSIIAIVASSLLIKQEKKDFMYMRLNFTKFTRNLLYHGIMIGMSIMILLFLILNLFN